MSRIGNKPIKVPQGIKVSIDGRCISVEGPKGKLTWTHRPEITLEYNEQDGIITVRRCDESRVARSLHGTTRTLIANMITGCLKGYEKALEIYGVGYGVSVQGNKVSLNVGYATPCVFDIPQGITVTVQTPQARSDNEPARFVVSGADKQLVGEFAAHLRRARRPEPYKGKGVRYADEHVRRKAGKAFAGTGG